MAVPAYATPGAAGFDLAAAEDALISPGEIKLVGTGLVFRVPDGYFLAIVARSSTPLKRGLALANSVGVLDSDYCGPDDELKLQLINIGRESVTVKTGDRLAQGIILQTARVEFEEGDTATTSRGGFGSTGA